MNFTQFFWIKKKQRSIQNFSDLFLDGCTYDDWFDKPNNKYLDNKTLESGKKEEFPDLPLMPTLEADKEEGKKEVKEETGI